MKGEEIEEAALREYPKNKQRRKSFINGASWMYHNANRFILVEEGLPKDPNERVIIVIGGNLRTLCSCLGKEVEMIHDVTHWMPMPSLTFKRKRRELKVKYKDMTPEQRRMYNSEWRKLHRNKTNVTYIRFTNLEIKQMIDLYNAGKSRYFISRFFGVSVTSVAYQLKKHASEVTR